MNSFYGRIMEIDLKTRTFQEREIREELLRQVLGGKGLGTYLLLANVEPGTDALSSENSLVFASGPLSSSAFPGAARYGVFSKSPLTGFYAESYSGGKVAPALKNSGYDAVVIRGSSATPIYLEVYPGGVSFCDAARIWGRDTYATEDSVLDEVGKAGAQAVAIGPAGENLVRFACIENNYWRSAGRTGLGAVMGSKKLKAVVFWGDRKVSFANDTELLQITDDLKRKGRGNPGVHSYQKLGTPQLVSVTNTYKCFPSRYWSSGETPGWENISGEMLVNKYKPKSRACPHCFMACGKRLSITEGVHKGLTIEGPEYETIYAFGGLCAISNLADIAYLNDLCDRLGIDTITAGNIAGLAIEAHRRGMLDYPVHYGAVEEIAELLTAIAYRREVGQVFADGILPAGRRLNLEDLVIHVKGMEPAGYDPRVLKGMGLSYAVSPRGACHLRSTFYKAELSGMVPAEASEGKAEKVIEFEDKLIIMDTLILCRFFRDLVGWDDLAAVISASTGFDISPADLRRKAAQICNLTRAFNLREGLTKEDDMLPPRLFKEPLGQCSLSPKEFEQMLEEYYKLRGWDQRGRITDATARADFSSLFRE